MNRNRRRRTIEPYNHVLNFDGELFGYNPYVDYTHEKYLEEIRAYEKENGRDPTKHKSPDKRLVEKPCNHCGCFHVAKHWEYVRLGLESPYCRLYKLLFRDNSNSGILCVECNRNHSTEYFCFPQENPDSTGHKEDRSDKSR